METDNKPVELDENDNDEVITFEDLLEEDPDFREIHEQCLVL